MKLQAHVYDQPIRMAHKYGDLKSQIAIVLLALLLLLEQIQIQPTTNFKNVHIKIDFIHNDNCKRFDFLVYEVRPPYAIRSSSLI